MPTLMGRLMAQPNEDLAELAGRWGARLPGRGHGEDVAALYRVMTDPLALRDVLESLSPAAARLLWTLARPEAPPELGLDAAARRAAADELRSHGLLFDERVARGTEEVVPDELAARVRRLADERRGADRSMQPLTMLLGTLDTVELAAAVEQWRLEVLPGTHPRAMVEAALLDAIAAPLKLDELIGSLDRTEKVLYDLVVAAGRPVALREVRRRLGAPPATLRRVLRRLNAALLVWESWSERERWLFVPADVRPRPRRTAPVLTGVPAVPAGWHHPLALAWDALAWRRWQQRLRLPAGDAALLPAGFPVWFGDGDGGRATYLEFLQEAVSQAPSADDEPLRPLLDQQAAIFARWRGAPRPWPATTGIPDWSDVRETTLAVLAGVEPGTWYHVEALAARIASNRAAPPPSSDSWQARRPSAPDPKVVTALLQSTLVWLGLVEAGRELERRRPAARVTALGAWLLGAGPRPAAGEPSLVAEPSLRLLVYEVDAALLWELLAFAETETLDRVSLFRLSRASVAAGLTAGLTVEAMLASLGRVSQHDLPQNLIYALRDWARSARHARITRALVLHFDDEQAREDALRLPALKELGATALPRDRILVPTPDRDTEERVRAVLRDLGFEE